MYFITSPVMLDMVKMLTPESIANVSNSLRFNKQDFVQYCNAGKCEEADKIVEENILQLTKSSNIFVSLSELARKFPSLNIDVSDIATCKDMTRIIGQHADKMLAIAREQRSHDN